MFLFVWLAAMASALPAVGLAGAAVAVAVPLGLKLKNKELERDLSLGINPSYKDFLDKKLDEARKAGAIIPPTPEEEYRDFMFNEGQLPEQMSYLLGQRWFLTQTELRTLLAQVEAEMMRLGFGDSTHLAAALCQHYSIPYEALAQLTKLVSGPSTFAHLAWLSDNRLADPTIKAMSTVSK